MRYFGVLGCIVDFFRNNDELIDFAACNPFGVGGLFFGLERCLGLIRSYTNSVTLCGGHDHLFLRVDFNNKQLQGRLNS